MSEMPGMFGPNDFRQELRKQSTIFVNRQHTGAGHGRGSRKKSEGDNEKLEKYIDFSEKCIDFQL